MVVVLEQKKSQAKGEAEAVLFTEDSKAKKKPQGAGPWAECKLLSEIIEEKRLEDQMELDMELAKQQEEGRRLPRQFAKPMSKERAIYLLTKSE